MDQMATKVLQHVPGNNNSSMWKEYADIITDIANKGGTIQARTAPANNGAWCTKLTNTFGTPKTE